MEHKVLYRNRGDGVKRTMITDDERPGEIRVFTELEMDRILDHVQEARDVEELRGARPTNRHLAVVPMTIYEQSLLEQWDDAKWKHWLNDPDNVHLRVWKGRV